MENVIYLLFLFAVGLIMLSLILQLNERVNKKRKKKSSFFDLLAYKIFDFLKNFSQKEEEYRPPEFILEKRLMDKREFTFYEMLKEKIGYHNYIILSKVRVEDFIRVNRVLPGNEVFGLRNQIKSRHVDFLICEKETTKPLIVIEIDGKSHNTPSRKERDEKLDKIYEEVSLPYTHVIVGEDFEKDIERIRKYLNPSFNLNK